MKKVGISFLLLAGIFSSYPAIASHSHDGNGMRCLECHVFLPFEGVPLLFHSDINSICSGCHASYHSSLKAENRGFSHPVSIVPSFKIPKDMPLDSEKRIGCMTCHVYHEEKKAFEDLQPFLLRRPPGLTFCYACHKEL